MERVGPLVKYLDILHGQYPDWHAHAACHPNHGHDPELWFPDAHGGARREKLSREAIAICKTCPVKNMCLTTAIVDGEQHGIRGGVDLEARARRRKGADDAA